MDEARITQILEEKRQELTRKCNLCKGLGFIEGGKRCECMVEFSVWNRLLRRGFPREYLEISLEEALKNVKLSKADTAILNEYINNFERVREDGLSLFLFGRRGAGKTSLAIAIAREYTKWNLDEENYIWNYTAFYLDISTFFERLIRKDFNFSETWWADMFVLDEFGQDVVGKEEWIWLIRDLERFIRFRIAQRKPTILVSNLEPKKIIEKYGEGLTSVLGVKLNSIDGIAYKSIHVEGVDLRIDRRFSRWK